MKQHLFRRIVLAGFLTLSLGLGGFTLWFWRMQQSGTGGGDSFQLHTQSTPRFRPFSPLSKLLQGDIFASTAWAHDEAGSMVLHSPRFVLVDRQAHIRGYYRSEEKTALWRLSRDIQTVRYEPRQP
jgi:hypothetical protein